MQTITKVLSLFFTVLLFTACMPGTETKDAPENIPENTSENVESVPNENSSDDKEASINENEGDPKIANVETKDSEPETKSNEDANEDTTQNKEVELAKCLNKN